MLRKRLKDVVLVATCCISFVAAFAVAMTTIAKGGARNLVATASILVSIVLVPPILVSICLSRHRHSAAAHIDEEAPPQVAAPPEFGELQDVRLEHGSLVAGKYGEELRGSATLATGVTAEVNITRLELELAGGGGGGGGGDAGELKQELEAVAQLSRRGGGGLLLPWLGFRIEAKVVLLASPRLPTLEECLPTLRWTSRCRTACSVGRGLSLLHSGGGGGAHGDITPRSIRLFFAENEDCDGCCISGVGLAKLTSMPLLHSPVTSATECSGDVYSFGLLLYVLLTGSLAAAAAAVRSRRLEVDARLRGGGYDLKQAATMKRVAQKCTHQEAGKRPDMVKVEGMLRALLLA